MSSQAKIYKCFIASPGDTNLEREICEKVFAEINQGIGNTFNFRIESLKWEKNSRPSFGEYSQGIINEQLGDNYQIFIGIMYKKFGTPTKVAGSGTEEEFYLAYNKITNKEKIEIMFYFNDESPSKLSDINPSELEKINSFKRKIAELGGYYWNYKGSTEFESYLRSHLHNFFLKEFKTSEFSKVELKDPIKATLGKIFKDRLDKALCVFSTQPIIWVEPILSTTNEISENPDENYNNRIKVQELIENPKSIIIKAPPQFGLTSLAHYLVKEAWEKSQLWIYLDAEKFKVHNIHNAVNNELKALGQDLKDVKCIILDSWNSYEINSFKKLKSLSDAHPDLPIYVMQTIDDSKFLNDPEHVQIDREFEMLHLLALPRTQIRKVVCEYNKAKGIGEEDVVLAKVVSDLDTLNIHRTPLNCLTLLKVSEKHFDESPVNRTNMLEMVLFVLFNLDSIPTYKIKPDLKDCEYILGRFCENLIKNGSYEFSREKFLNDLNSFCEDKLIDLEVEVVFDVLTANNIIIKRELNFTFRASYWIFYFAAKRMHNDKDFAEYIFSSKKYISFPEIIEFYTGIDRNRSDALKILTNDLANTAERVQSKVGLPENMNPLTLIHWKPTEDQIERVKQEISNNVINSGLPESLKDQHADRSYNQIKPYDQSIKTIFEDYSVAVLMQKIKASSRALRNSDYVEPALKRELLSEILRGWEQLSKVLFALTPVLATRGQASVEGTVFYLSGDFGNTIEDKVKMIIQVNPTNVVAMFKEDIYSSKIGPLLYDQFLKETNALKKHQLALLLIFTRPRDWKKHIEAYISSIHKNSFYLYDLVNSLRARYKFDFASVQELKEIEYLLKMGLAKHEFGDKKPGMDKIVRISNKNLPKRESETD